MHCLSYEMQVYSPDDDCYYPSNAVPNGADGKPKKVLKLSGTEVRKRLKTGEEIPAWFSYPDVVARSGGLAIAAPIAPYKVSRDFVRETCEAEGGFMEVYVAASLDLCEARDKKGLYAKARKGIIKGMTGVDDPYEEPKNPEIRIETGDLSVAQAVDQVMDYLYAEGYILREKKEMLK